MKVLFIGGTGNISTSVSRLAITRGIELHLLTRGQRPVSIPGAHAIRADIGDEAAVTAALQGHHFDCVVNWIGYKPAEMERDIRLFAGRTRQYIFISSASVYQKPATTPFVREDTPLRNPYWDYSHDKILCEDRLQRAYRDSGFPMTIVRPALTYDTVIPVALGSWDDYTLIDRMRRGGKIVVHGDGTSLWSVTHARDFAKGFVGLIGNMCSIGHAFHITTDEVLTWNQIYEAIGAAIGVEPQIVHVPSDFIAAVEPWHRGNLHGDKAVSKVFDNSKIKRFVPGYVATIPFAEGIRETIAWFEADPARMRIVEDNNRLLDRIIRAYETAFTAISSS